MSHNTHPAKTVEEVIRDFTQRVREWRLDTLLYHLLEGQQAAKYQIGWYLQYQISPEEIQQFLEAFKALEKADPNNLYIPWIKMIYYLYGIGVSLSLEHSRRYLQEYQHHNAASGNLEDPFIREFNEVNQLPEFLRLQWFASQGNGDAVCDLAQLFLTETENPQDIERAIKLLSTAANFGHLRALESLVILYTQNKYISSDADRANYYARKAFLRKIRINVSEPWQIKDLPIQGYSERLVERNIIRTYHETLCMLQPEFDFLFAKDSTLVPLVHQPSVHGVLENLKTDPHYFIEHLINFDKDNLQYARLQKALERLIKYCQLPKIQRDQVHLLLAYAYTQENKIYETAEQALNIKQPYIYIEVIRALDPAGELGQFLLSCVTIQERFAQIKDLQEVDALQDYALIYLIACVDTLDAAVKETLQQYLKQKFLVAEDLQTLSTLHIEYCQLRYAIYKIHHRIYLRSWWSDYLLGQQRLRQRASQGSWENILYQLQHAENLNLEALSIIQKAYPLLTNSLDHLRQASPIALKQVRDISGELLKSLQRSDHIKSL